MKKEETIDVLKSAVTNIINFNTCMKENYRKYQSLVNKHPLLVKKIKDVQDFCREQNKNFNIHNEQIVNFSYDLCVYTTDNLRYCELIHITTEEGETYYRDVTGTSLSCIADECHSFVACYLEALTTPEQQKTATKFKNEVISSQIENLHITMLLSGGVE